VVALAAAAVLQTDVEKLKALYPVRQVRVEGPLWNSDAEAFRGVLAPLTRTGLFNVDLAGIEAAVKAMPWTDRVEVARAWPDTVVVRLVEHEPVARWGENGLLNRRGESFAPPNAADYAHLPRLSGPPGQEKPVLAMLEALSRKFESRQLRIEGLSLSTRRAWVAQLAGNLEIVYGKKDPLAATDRLLTLLPQLGEEGIAGLARVDLRYSNGFAVIWKPDFLGLPALIGPSG
jgi:cell division protein FtsQ